MSNFSYAEILHAKVIELGDGCFQCGASRVFGDFCGRECQAEYYRTGGPNQRWEVTELATEREYQKLMREASLR